MRRRSSALVTAAAAAGLLFIGSVSMAVDRTWFGGDGVFQSGSNWNPSGVPQLSDRVFMNSGVATVAGGLGVSGGECSDAFIGDQVGSAAAILLTQANPPTVGAGLHAAGHLVIGNRGSGQVTVPGTRVSLRAATLSLGAQPGSSGRLSVNGSLFTSASVTGNLYVGGSPAGPGGVGTLTVSGGSTTGFISVGDTTVIYPGGYVRLTDGNSAGFNHVRQDGGFFQNVPGFLLAGFMISGTYELYGGSTQFNNMTAGRMRVSGGMLGLDANSRVNGDLEIAPRASQATPAALQISGAGELMVGGNLHVGGTMSGPVGPAVLQSGAQLRGGAGTSSVIVHQPGVLTATDPLNFPGGIVNHGTVRPNGDNVGQMMIGAGGLDLASDGRVEITIHALNSADSIVAAPGGVEVDGLLAASFEAPFTSNLGDSFQIISAPYVGRFSNVDDLVIAGDRRLEIQYAVGEVRLLDIGPVPEPGALGPAAALCVFVRRRR